MPSRWTDDKHDHLIQGMDRVILELSELRGEVKMAVKRLDELCEVSAALNRTVRRVGAGLVGTVILAGAGLIATQL